MSVVALVLGLCLYGFVTGIQELRHSLASNSQERQAKLQALMPATPSSLQFVREGYDPKANCFDKCGYAYRDYRFSDETTVCAEVIEAMQADMRGLVVEYVRDQAIDAAICNRQLDKVRKNAPAYRNENFPIAASMRHMINDKPVVDHTQFGSVVINLETKEVSYRVSQEYANYTFANP